MPDAFKDTQDELASARKRFDKFASAHEGYAILLEEVEELKREVFWGPTEEAWGEDPVARRMKLMRAEAVQVAAMAIRFIEDVCDA